jgi:ATP-binding cassette subfamily C protein
MLDPRERRVWIALVPLAVVAALMETVGALLIFGLIGLMTDAVATDSLPGIAQARALFPDIDDRSFIVVYAVFVAVFFLIKNGYRLLETYAQQSAAARTAVLMSTRLLERYLHAPYEFHQSQNSAVLIRNTHGSVDQVTRTVLTSVTAALSELLVIAAIAAALAFAAPAGTFVASVIAIVVTIPLLRVMQSRYARWGGTIHEKNAAIQRHLQESFRGIREIKVLSGERYFVSVFERPRFQLAQIQRWTATLQVMPRLAVETFFVMGIVIMFVFATSGDIQGSQLLAYIGLIAYALMRLLPSLHLLVYHLNNSRIGQAAVDQLYADWHSCPTVSESGAGLVESQAEYRFESELKFAHVHFHYPGSGGAGVHDLNFTIRRGESIGVVGQTGAGKSTLVDLLLGLQVPGEGVISVDGQPIQSVLRQWQSRIGYVPQQPFFIDDSVRSNVAFGVDDMDVDTERVWKALEVAQLRSRVEELPAGLDTIIGEAGTRLSGGELQRLALARALYREPDVLVLDEATSALDTGTENAILSALNRLRRDREMTFVVISHRLRAIRNCGRLLLLSHGVITDSGSYEDLLARNDDFRKVAGLSDGHDD